MQPTQPITTVTQFDNSVACIFESSSLGPWILDFGVADHMFGNKSLFSLPKIFQLYFPWLLVPSKRAIIVFVLNFNAI